MDLSQLSYAVFDVETTGGSPSAGHRVTEIAAVVVHQGKIVEIFEQLLDPERDIPPFITQLTGISNAMVMGQPRFPEVAHNVLALLGEHVFVAHNAAFDWRFVNAELSRTFDKTATARTLCTVRLSRALLPHLPRKSLDYVAHHYGVRDIASRYPLKRGVRHSAAGDAIVTAHCLMRLLDDAADRGLTTWADLDRHLSSAARRRTRRWSAMPTSTLDDRTA